ncbi:MAG: hypothetical protein HRT65_05645 [Flavobacteriaceae bacterium]|nr:hypothetical protein [Flavobacteriaceae bacterium]
MKTTIFALFMSGILLWSCSNDASDTEDQIVTTPTNDEPVIAMTAIPDIEFERNLIELGFDDEEDGMVRTSNIQGIKELILNDKGISSFEGIEDFEMLENLWAVENNLTTLDLTSNTLLKFVFVDDNALTEIRVQGLGILEKISASRNQLTAIPVSGNAALQLLVVDGNQIESIDVTSNFDLNNFDVTDNPLTCIKVNSTQLETIPETWVKDDEDRYALDCN